MNLDDLISAAKIPTPEIIKEINEKVNKAATLCGNDHNWIKKGVVPSHTLYDCVVCGITSMVVIGNPPLTKNDIETLDYTKPENFWPLARENNLCIFYDGWLVVCNDVIRYFDTKKYYTDHYNDLNFVCLRFDDDDEKFPVGVAVCLVYLKIKENQK